MHTYHTVTSVRESPAMLDKLMRLQATRPTYHCDVDKLIEAHLDRLLLCDIGIDVTAKYRRYFDASEIQTIEESIHDILIQEIARFIPPVDGEVVNFTMRKLKPRESDGPYQLHPGYDLYVEIEPSLDDFEF